jgi:hypothetical protein
MLHISMNKRTKRLLANLKVFLAKFRFQQSQNQIDFKPKNKPQEYYKRGSAITAFVNLKCFSMNMKYLM